MNELYLERIGKVLKQKREAAGYSIEFVANKLKINPEYITALENGNLDIFPAKIFLKGFYKNYIRFLDLDEESMIQQYDELFGQETSAPVFPENAGEGEKTKKIFPMKYIVIAGVIIVIGVSWLQVSSISRKKDALEKKTATGFKPVTTSKEIALHEGKKKFFAGGEKEKEVIIIKAKENCWTEIKYEGNSLFQGLLFAGEMKEFTYKKGMTVRLGNAAGVELIVKGETKANLGKVGEVREILID